VVFYQNKINVSKIKLISFNFFCKFSSDANHGHGDVSSVLSTFVFHHSAVGFQQSWDTNLKLMFLAVRKARNRH
jgi:hypothetical protein